MSARPQTKDKPAKATFQWDDPFLLDDQLTEDERMIRDTRARMLRTSCCRA
jgi:glutaryl-CoA dehydrogenase